MGTSVLIVEDESIVALDLANRLKGLGFAVVGSAGSGDSAFKLAQVHRPDVILMDIRIKGSTDGIETARKIKNELDIPSIFLTAYSDSSSLDRAKRADAYGYLLKPFQERELQITIELALYKHSTEGELRRNRSLLETTLNSVDHGVIAIGRSGSILFLNAAAETMTGRTSDKAVGCPLRAVFQITSAPTGGSSDRYELLRPGGDTLPVEVTTQKMSAIEEHHPAEVIVFRDISDALRYEETLLKAKEAAEAASRAKNDFLARVSHELRTPMNSIIGMSQLASESDNPTEIKEFLEIVVSSAQTLKNQISDVLDFVTYDKGVTPQHRDIISVSELVDTIARSHALVARQKNLRLLAITDPSLPSRLYGDEKRISRIVGNLLSNAVKFTVEGHIVFSVSLLGKSGTDNEKHHGPDEVLLEYSIEDTGKGISSENIPRVFEDFSQLEAPATRSAGGSGLGLAIVRRLVNALNGEVTVDSTVGSGTVMKVVLPLGVAVTKTVLEEFQERLRGSGQDDHQDTRTRVSIGDPLLFRTVERWAEATGTELRLADEKGGLLINETDPGPVVEPPDSFTCFLIGSGNLIRLLDRKNRRVRERPRDDRNSEAVRKKKVLIVDDDRINLMVHKKLVEDMGYTVEAVNNGETALNRLRQHSFFFACVDIEMPGMNGWDVIAEIRNGNVGERGKRTPVVAITGHNPVMIRTRAEEAGFDAVLSKPFAVEDLQQLFGRFSEKIMDGHCLPENSDEGICRLKQALKDEDIHRATELIAQISEILRKPQQCETLFRMKLAIRRGDAKAAEALISGLEN